jgi:hypothetical protein
MDNRRHAVTEELDATVSTPVLFSWHQPGETMTVRIAGCCGALLWTLTACNPSTEPTQNKTSAIYMEIYNGAQDSASVVMTVDNGSQVRRQTMQPLTSICWTTYPVDSLHFDLGIWIHDSLISFPRFEVVRLPPGNAQKFQISMYEVPFHMEFVGLVKVGCP